MLDPLYLESNTDSPLSSSSVSLLEGYADGLAIDPRPLTPAALHSASIDEAWLSEGQTVDSYQHLLAGDLFSFDIAAQHSASSSVLSPAAYDTETFDFLTGNASAFFGNDDILSPQSAAGSWYQQGSLKADRFTVDLNKALTVISGNGNVEYGYGRYDYLDLSNLFSNSIASWSPAESEGVLFDTGNGARVFDSLVLTNGSRVLFEGLDSVQFADAIIDLSVDPNDPLFGEQWNLHMMGVQNAWRFTQGSSDVLIGVQDTGLGYSSAAGGFHPDLDRDRLIYSSNNVSDDFSSDDSHGTSVQSIIGATSDNGFGMSGINWNSNIYNIDVIGNNTDDLGLTDATQNMINYANSQGQRLIINMSLSTGGISSELESLIANNQNNALFVVSSGNNDNSSINDPAGLGNIYENVIAVGASWGKEDYYGQSVRLGDRISYEGWWGSNYGEGLSLMGPSEVIAAEADAPRLGGQFDFAEKFNGTSAAAPNVAGVASLVWSVNPYLSATQVHSIMAETAYDLGAAGYDYETGFGFVNADAAVRRAMAIARTSQASNPFSVAMAITATESLAESTLAYAPQLTESVVVETAIANQFVYQPVSRQFGGSSLKPPSTAVESLSEIPIEIDMAALEIVSEEPLRQKMTVQADLSQTAEMFQLPLPQVLNASFDFAV